MTPICEKCGEAEMANNDLGLCGNCFDAHDDDDAGPAPEPQGFEAWWTTDDVQGPIYGRASQYVEAKALARAAYHARDAEVEALREDNRQLKMLVNAGLRAEQERQQLEIRVAALEAR